MDRLSSLIASPGLAAAAVSMVALPLVALSLAGCDDDSAPSAPPPGRVVAVAAEDEGPATDEVCDVAPDAADAPQLTFPALAEGDRPPAGQRRRWVNVWATWCRPCVEEMPLLQRWRDQLRSDGAEVELVFLSADRDDETVAAFRQEHAGMPESLRVADPQAIPEWASSLGLPGGASLPIHVLTDERGRVVCARAGAVSEGDYEAVRAVLRGD